MLSPLEYHNAIDERRFAIVVTRHWLYRHRHSQATLFVNATHTRIGLMMVGLGQNKMLTVGGVNSTT